jgi:uncharacterized protein
MVELRMVRSSRRVRYRIQACLLMALSAVGCASSLSRMADGRTSYLHGDFKTARLSLEKAAKSHKLADTAQLDLAMIELADGHPEKAEERLRRLRDRFDALPAVAPVGATVSLATDDRSRQFRPSDYEQVLVRTLLAITSLARDGSDAEAYTLQSIAKSESLGKTPPAITPYLRGVLREATYHDFDDATKAYAQVAAINPMFAPAGEDIARASGGSHSQPGHGVLYVVAFTGQGPVLESVEASTTSAALSIASSVWSAEVFKVDQDKSSGLPASLPNIATVKVPEVVIPPSEIAAVGVTVDRKVFGATQTLTDVGRLAVEQNQAEMPMIMARAIVRRAFKEATVTAAARGINLDGRQASLFQFAVASAWASLEKADTRCWSLLPREFQVFRVELPEGDHLVRYAPIAARGVEIGQPIEQVVKIEDGRNTYRFVIAPDRKVSIVNPKE